MHKKLGKTIGLSFKLGKSINIELYYLMDLNKILAEFVSNNGDNLLNIRIGTLQK